MACIHFVPPFARKRAAQAVLAATVVAGLPTVAMAEAARVTFAHGPVFATAGDGSRRTLARGADIEAGDTVSTGRGRAQLRFTDGSFVSLKPQTEFRVDEYEFKSRENTRQRGFFSLLRGGLRTITGLIGRARKAGYRMRTSVATIGIRGTEYTLDFDGERLHWAVADDGKSSISIVLGNGEEQIISSGGSGSATKEQFEQLVKSLQQLADEGKLAAGISADELLEIFVAADLTPPQPLAEVPPPTCTAAQPCALVAAFGAQYDGGEGIDPVAGIVIDGGEGVAAGFDSATGALLDYQFLISADNGAVGTAKAVRDGSANFSVDPANPTDPRAIATWGRWIAPGAGDGASVGSSPHPLIFEGGSQDTFAYVVSLPTATVFNQGTAQFTLTGFTPPAVLGARGAQLGAPGNVTGTLTASFGPGDVSVNMAVPFANGTYSLSASALPLGSGASAAFFGGSLSVTGTGVACTGGGCTGALEGNLFGPRADGAAVGYKIGDFDGEVDSDVTGAAVFQQQSCGGCATVTPP